MATRDYVAKYRADLTQYDLDPAIADTRKLAETTDRTADSVRRDFRDMARSVDRSTKDIDHDLDKTGRDVKGHMGELGSEAGSEFAQNLGESISSGQFDGGTLMGTIGGLAGSLGATGPIGAALAGLATVGALAFSAIQAKAAQTAAAVAASFDDAFSGADQAARIQSRLTAVFGDVQSGAAKVAELVRGTGLSTQTVLSLITGEGKVAKGTMGKLADEIARANSNLNQPGSGGVSGVLGSDTAASAQALLDIVDQYGPAFAEGTSQANKLKGAIDAVVRAASKTDTAADLFRFDPRLGYVPRSSNPSTGKR